MYSGNSVGGGSNMLYGGPLGAYLSGIYQPSSSSSTRRGSLYGSGGSSGGGVGSGAGSGSTASSVGASSLFYTPQPTRRKFGGSSDSVGSTDSGRGISPRQSGYSSRWSSGTSFSTDTAPDYKKLYEAQLAENEVTRADLERVKRQLQESRQDVIAQREKRNNSKQSELEKKVQVYEEEVKNLASLKAENVKIKEENIALIRVISKLSK